MDPYLGEIRIVGFLFAPVGWQECDGSLLSIAENDALYSLLGTTYGGDGQTTFGVPDFRGRVAVGQGQGDSTSNYTLGEMAGTESVTLLANQVGAHSHTFHVSDSPADTASPAGGSFAVLPVGSRTENLYGMTGNGEASATMIETSGSGQPHENRPPTQCLLYVIATEGIYPSQS